ncbi:MAG: hypothetical protein K2O00_02940 [Muribaculaceae bacterium]|nr:hypothetical protein [Muribaculaceae bacterium]
MPLDIPSVFGTVHRNAAMLEPCSVMRFSPELRLKYALVWFSVVTPVDAYSIDKLDRNDLEAARDILAAEQNSFSSRINSAVLSFLDGKLETGIAQVISVIENERLRNEFVKAIIGDEPHPSEEKLYDLFAELLSEYLPFDTISLGFNSNSLAINTLNELYRRRWSSEVENELTLIRSESYRSASIIADKLRSISGNIDKITEITPLSNAGLGMLRDSVARTVLEKSIDLYNAGVTEQESKIILSLLKQVASIASGTPLKERCKENYSSLLSNLNCL